MQKNFSFIKMLKNTLQIIFFACIIVFSALYFGFSFFVASQIVAPNHARIDILPSVISQDFENISVNTKDNITLKGWLFKNTSNKLIIMVAGFRQNRINNDYYGVLIAKELIDLNYNVLLFDNQATGESGGNHITFGIKESRDLISVVNFAKTKGFEAKNIGIIGDSMGAISLLLVSDQLKDIGAMVVDSPAKNIKNVITNILQNENHISPFFHPGIFFILRYAYQIDVNAIQPALHVAKVPQRVFLYLHGGLDTSIYPLESKELLAISNPKSKLVIFPNGKHIETYKNDPELYRKTVFPFLLQNLGNN
jgi:pimeloyl-ACP methyl ester carboxylesterase